MNLLPLIPSAHPSARLAEAVGAERQDLCQHALERARHTCQFCGLPAGGWQDVFHLDDDHNNWTPVNVAAACPLCHAVQHIGSPTANQDMHVIWLPDVEQPLLNVLVRGIHTIMHSHGVPTTLTARHMPDDAPLEAAWRAYAALNARRDAANRVIDSHYPLDLADALAAMSPRDYARRAKLLGGLRLLHRGQMLRHGHDLYPVNAGAKLHRRAGAKLHHGWRQQGARTGALLRVGHSSGGLAGALATSAAPWRRLLCLRR